MQKFWCNELNRFKYSIKRIFVNLPELRVETAITNLVRVTHKSNNKKNLIKFVNFLFCKILSVDPKFQIQNLP
jgi:hypothetical protein